MKKIFLLLSLCMTVSSFSQNDKKISLREGINNTLTWIINLDKVIDKIVEKEKLKKLKRELSDLADDINKITSAKSQLINAVTSGDSTTHYDEVQDLQNSIKEFQESFNKVNRLIPAEYKTTNNPLTYNLNNQIRQKLENLIKIKKALFNLEPENDFNIQHEIKVIHNQSEKIEKSINNLILKIEKKIKNQ